MLNRRINILFLDHQAELGGAEVFLFEIIKNLDKAKFNPIVKLGAEGLFKDKLEGFGIRPSLLNIPEYFRGLKREPSRKNSFVSMLRSQAMLPRLIKETQEVMRGEKIDIVIANTVKSAYFGIAACRKAKVKSLWIVHDCLKPEFYGRLFLKVIKGFSKHADRIICVSEGVKKSFLSLQGRGYPGRPAVVYNGVDLDRFNINLKENYIEKELALSGQRVVTLIGRLEPWKGQKVFIRAAKIALAQRPDMKFLIAGGALFGRQDYETECRELIRESGLEDKIMLLDFREDIPQIILASDIIVHTSILPEPFGRDIIEAFACAKPVISTNIGAPREIITADTGVLVEPNNPEALAEEIIGLIDDEAKRSSLGVRARERAQELFDIKKITKQIENIILGLFVE